MTAEEWAQELGVSRQTIHNYETKKKPPLEILRTAATLVGAPLEFMEHGWSDPPAASAELEARVRELEQRLRGISQASSA